MLKYSHQSKVTSKQSFVLYAGRECPYCGAILDDENWCPKCGCQ